MAVTSAHIRGCIFDLDGVVVDTFRYHFQAWRRVAQNLGFEFTEDHHHLLQGMSRMQSLEKILELGHIYLPDAEKLYWSDVKNNWYIELLAQMTPEEVLPGVRRMLEEMTENDLSTALVSSSRNARTVLESLQLDMLFDAVIDGNMIKKAKPDPERYLLAARNLNLEPAECLVFEDTLPGVIGAAYGGFWVVGVGDPRQLAPANLTIPNFETLSFDYLQTLTGRTTISGGYS